MPKSMPIFYSAVLLTFVNLLLRCSSTVFQVYLSRQLGPGGMGLMQLTMSVCSLALVAGLGGVRTASMYLTAEVLGRRREGQLVWVVSGCLCYSIFFSGAVAFILYTFAPGLAEGWIGNSAAAPALRLYAAFLPTACLTAVMVGCFTGRNRIAALSAVEVAEQVITIAITVLLLRSLGTSNPVRACMAVILGSGLGGCITLLNLVGLHLYSRPGPGEPLALARRLADTALPLGAADLLKSGINTLESLMVPRRLALHPGTPDALAAFGLVGGMVFPVIMFPACLLFGLGELLVPELARCAAAGSESRIRYLVRRALWLALLFGCVTGGLLFLLAEPLCDALYRSPEGAYPMGRYALLIPMLYCDAITDAMTKGLGQQKACVGYNILTSSLDVALLFVLLPRLGMEGYFLSFALTHALNFFLSLRRLLRITSQRPSPRIPVSALAVLAAALILSMTLSSPRGRAGAFLGLLLPGWMLLGVISRENLTWLRNLPGKAASRETPPGQSAKV